MRTLIAAGALLAAPGIARAERVNLLGTVIDSVGRPVVGVEIQILDQTGRTVAHAVSGDRGRYKIRCVETGSYGVRLVPGENGVLGRTVPMSLTDDGRRIDWTVDPSRPALPRPIGFGGRCDRTAIAAADSVPSLLGQRLG
ncbi:MAG TPA: carboxypeptidase-like regulatory domain-containing protein [Candidatus Binatia bacterium]|nr:carboxypeptidase-like regulatory domain-containing protein [Candidatus Binatia bacterium]